MHKRIKYALQYFQETCGNVTSSVIHEMGHYIPAVILWCFGLIATFPKMKLVSPLKITIDEEGDSYRIESVSMYVYYQTRGDRPVVNLITGIGPAVLVVLLLIFSPWYMYLYYICNISVLWLSPQDSKDIIQSWKEIKDKFRNSNKPGKSIVYEFEFKKINKPKDNNNQAR